MSAIDSATLQAVCGGRWLQEGPAITALHLAYDTLEPSQTKSHHFIALVNGRYACVPGNNVLWKESSFIREGGKPDWLKIQSETWHAEEPGFDRVVTEDSA